VDAPLNLLYFNGFSYQTGAIPLASVQTLNVSISFQESKPQNAVRDPENFRKDSRRFLG
jgi:hypothetical protein